MNSLIYTYALEMTFEKNTTLVYRVEIPNRNDVDDFAGHSIHKYKKTRINCVTTAWLTNYILMTEANSKILITSNKIKSTNYWKDGVNLFPINYSFVGVKLTTRRKNIKNCCVMNKNWKKIQNHWLILIFNTKISEISILYITDKI